jgi:RHS repeat-associated protein
MYTDFMFLDPSGSSHALGLALGNTGLCDAVEANYSTSYSGGDEFYHAATQIGATDPSSVPFSVWDKDGTLFHFPNNIAGDTGSFPDYIEDRNGNKLNISTTGYAFPVTVTDTAGRKALSISSIAATGGDKIEVSGLSNSYDIQWQSTPYSVAIPLTDAFCQSVSGFSPIKQSNVSSSGSQKTISSITLPDKTATEKATDYQFTYDPVSGLLDKVTYPNGGYISYVWGPTQTPSDYVYYIGGPNTNTGVITGGYCGTEYSRYAVLKRTVYDGTQVTQIQTFNYATNWDSSSPNTFAWTSKTTTVTTKDMLTSGNPTFTTVYSYEPSSVASPPDTGEYTLLSPVVPVESSIAYNGTNGSTLKTVAKTWVTTNLLGSETTTLGTQQSKVTYHYGSWDNITEKDETDFGTGIPGPIIRKTLTTYASFPATPLGTAPGDKPCKVLVEDGSSKSTVLAETDTLYDGGTTVCGTPGTPSVSSVSDLPSGSHDETNYGSTATTARGNATSVSQQNLQTSTSSTTTYTYDETGQVTSSTDPCGNPSCSDIAQTAHKTQYVYTDSPAGANPYGNSNAYLTQITRPNTGVAHVEKYQYNYATGELSQGTDENSRVTTYSYTDPLNRLTDILGPPSVQNGNAQPHTQYKYVDGSNATMTTTNPVGVVSETLYDGLNRVKQTVLTTDPGGADIIDTTYDDLGRVFTVSNSYRASGNPISPSYPTDGVTTYYYDSLGRKTLQLQPDNVTTTLMQNGVPTTQYSSAQQWSYIGNTVMFTDEMANQWQRTTDGLGRLTKLLEPNGTSTTPSMETDYTYDALDNLLSVTQCGAACSPLPANAVLRGFSYDSLSRLISATNPESGTATYSYDANGNLTTKTSPAVNASSGTQTLGYCYDALNRMTAKFYSAPASCATTTGAAATYSYDASSIPGASNVIGRLTDEKAYIGSTLVSERSPYSYDEVGRLANEQQCPYIPACTTVYTFNYAYDLAGNLTSSNNGLSSASYASSSLTFGFSYDGAGHMQSAGTTSQPSSWNGTASGTAYPTMLMQANQSSPAAYDPMGHLVNAQLGLPTTSATPALNLARQYDDRGRITLEIDDSITFYQIPAGGYAPNGNMLSINDTITGNWKFGYDTLNRLISGVSTSGPFSGDYGCWTYDAFGNRTQEALSNTTLTPCAANANDNVVLTTLTPIPGTNRAKNFTYDDAGDVLADGNNVYGYDAEGRICGVATDLVGQISIYQYLYDAEGRRVAKGSTTNTTTICPAPTSANGFHLTNQYLLGPSGEQVTELAGTSGATPWHTNVWTSGGQLNTYDFANGGLHFSLHDAVGTKRIQISGAGVPELSCASLAFGDSPGNGRTTACVPWGSSTAPDATEQHYTGQIRDTESGNDYFGARYYSSTLGRFMSPDPSGLLAQRPEDPQSWNMYAYARNNPLIFIDPNGLDCIYATDNGKGVESIDHNSSSGECGGSGGTWLSGYVDEDWAHYNKTAKAFEAASEDGGQVNFAQFQAGAQTNDSGGCLSGCGSYGFASTSADFLTGQLVGNSRPTDGSDPLDGLLTFMTKRDQAVTDFWKGVAGPINGKDNWAGPGGMGPPQGTGDWRAAVHDYNFNTNGITIGSYFNPHLSPATSRALIQSNNNLMRTGGVQGAKEKLTFGVINAFQWYADSWK